ncbi:hypothetical protein [Paenibacillus sp. Soil724D2]|uniref:hypothetical protein n=1 Tax=Paenibacillus sp. (strain Soil724D2) TaxID=1736392 RepID=UPI0007139D03|nr:hypothetical protein [Paenibacillus sp. Soil724D2]KRE33279.1 hypothetical protein ASG85_13440 [Paenibacillus sp. Soil724D2]
MTLQEQLDQVNEQLSNLDNNNRGDLPEISRLTTLQAELTNQLALEVRVQVQEEKVESITLPYNFDEIFDDNRANEIIIELIRDLQRQAYAEHNEELTEIATAHREEVRAAADRELQLKRQNDELQLKLDEYSQEALNHHKEVNQLMLERDEALKYRDAAVREKEGIELLLSEKQAQIDTLRDEIAVGARAAVNVTNISPTDRLSALVEESKKAKVKSALDIALENATPFRGKVISDGQVVANLDAPQVTPFPVVDQTSDTGHQLVTGPADSIPAEDQVTFPGTSPEVQTLSATVASGDASENGQTLEEAFRRIKALELKVSGIAVGSVPWFKG